MFNAILEAVGLGREAQILIVGSADEVSAKTLSLDIGATRGYGKNTIGNAERHCRRDGGELGQEDEKCRDAVESKQVLHPRSRQH